MTTYFVSRHAATKQWATECGLSIDRFVDHFDVTQTRQGDVVAGSMPVNLVADICERGGRYLHLAIDLPVALRGKELSLAELKLYRVRFEEYRVSQVKDAIQ